jgi:hypothetical protein
MGFGVMTSVLTNNVAALVALANGLLPLRKIARAESDRRRDIKETQAEPVRRDLVGLPLVIAASASTPTRHSG